VRFTDIVGHEGPRTTLAQAITRDRLHHAYLFTGPDGIGKRRVALGLVARLFCGTPDAHGDACGTCRHCRRVLESAAWYDERSPFATKDDAPELAPRHPDLLTLVAHGNFIKISQIREALRVIPFQPVEAPCRVVLIDEAHTMNDEAANALLKTLEEPPSKTRFILTSSQPSNLLVTIRSRCQRIAFSRLPDAELRAVLARRGSDPDTIDAVLPLAGGSARVAIGLLDDPLTKQWDPLARRLVDLALTPASPTPQAKTFSAILELALALSELPQREALFDRLTHLLRDTLLLRTGTQTRLFHEALREPLGQLATRMSPEGLLARLELIEDTRMLTRTFNMQPRLAFERLLLALLAPPGAEASKPLLNRRDTL
jgi:DNA polymerase-3 subunit delta'